MFESVEFNWMPIIVPLIVLIVLFFAVALIYKMFFNWLPKKLYNFLLGPLMLVAAYIWAFPMKMGFYELFK